MIEIKKLSLCSLEDAMSPSHSLLLYADGEPAGIARHGYQREKELYTLEHTGEFPSHKPKPGVEQADTIVQIALDAVFGMGGHHVRSVAGDLAVHDPCVVVQMIDRGFTVTAKRWLMFCRPHGITYLDC